MPQQTRPAMTIPVHSGMNGQFGPNVQPHVAEERDRGRGLALIQSKEIIKMVTMEEKTVLTHHKIPTHPKHLQTQHQQTLAVPGPLKKKRTATLPRKSPAQAIQSGPSGRSGQPAPRRAAAAPPSDPDCAKSPRPERARH